MPLNIFNSKKIDPVNLLNMLKELKRGNFGIRLPMDYQGIQNEIASEFNEIMAMMEEMITEFSRIGKVVGKEGQINARIHLPNVVGGWEEQVNAVNTLIGDLAHPMIEMSRVIGAVANGDLTNSMALSVNGRDLQGAFYDTAQSVNTMVIQLDSFASEVTRVAREVGTEGKLGGQADVKELAGGGTWRELTENVNKMASNLTSQVRNIAEVTTAVANGDLTRKITVNVKGEILQLKNTINTMVDQLSSFASEVTRVAKEVGTEGKLGGQADVQGVAGTWRNLTENVNKMASNLTSQVRNIAEVTTAVAKGDLTRKITVDVKGEILELKNTINTMVDQLSSFASEVTRVAREVGTEGKLGGQAYVTGVGGTWKDLTDNVNHMADNLTSQVRNIAGVTKAVADGDLSKKITVDAKGEIFELKNTVNIMVDQLSSFASEVTRVAHEVGTEGKLGGQAVVKGVGGIWKDFTNSVNQMAFNLTEQVRSIAKVVTAVAQGDLKKKLVVQAKGEIAALSEIINNMIDTLAIFADQVTSVACEVGVEGRLGGQASVPGASGTWKALTDNVNELAANLTNQVRAISKVASAVTMGDLTGTIQVKAQGEVAALKDILNEMISNLKETTLKNAEQDWLKTNIAKITRILQGQKDLGVVARLILSELVPMVSSQHGIFFMSEIADGEKVFRMLASYAYRERKNVANYFKIGEGLVGQCAYEKERIVLTNVPDDYIQITSGLGEHKPLNIVVLPILFEGEVKAIIELGTFDHFTRTQLSLLDQLPEIVGIVLNSIETNSRTESLLKQSQMMASELGNQKEELKKTNEELEEKAEQLAIQNTEVAQKNKEVEIAKRALEEKAEQLALASKYKSEFLANMSHELRTPLNSLLLLSQHLANNSLGNLTAKQIEYAKTISSSGNDLLNLINDILDLAKIESGVAELSIDEIELKALINDVERMFSHIAENKSLNFKLIIADDIPQFIQSDGKRLSQVLKNFLSNAYKFTEKGGITLHVFVAKSGWQENHPILTKALNVIAFKVSDTGPGIPLEKQQIIFEAFQQADGTTNRKYGGCGLGLSISREIALLLGGEITLQSQAGEGSIFTFYLPQFYISPPENKEKPPAIFSKKDDSVQEVAAPLFPFPSVVDDRFNIKQNDSIIIMMKGSNEISEDNLKTIHAYHFKLLITLESNEALNFIEAYPIAGIIIDITTIKQDTDRLIKRLKGALKFQHIPIYIINGNYADRLNYLKKGIRFFSEENLMEVFLTILIDIKELFKQPAKKILFSSRHKNRDLLRFLNDEQIDLLFINNKKSLPELQKQSFDCIIFDDWTAECEKLIDKIPSQSNKVTPIIVYNNQQLDKESEIQLQKIANSSLIKVAHSPEMAFEVISSHLHHKYSSNNPHYPQLKNIYDSNQILKNKKILIVDDDIRNIFAVTSALEDYEVDTITATSGNEALKILETISHIDCILMDIMMPDMDGYEAMLKIREQPRFENLVIIAITAKAMKDDCAKCIRAGASDYIPKPIDNKTLLSTLRLWLR